MNSKRDLIQTFISEKINQWETIRAHEKKGKLTHLPAITISMAAGSGGSIVAQRIAECLGFDFFHREIIQAIAESGKLSPDTLKLMEKERLSGVRDFVALFLDDRYLWPGVYLDHLKKVVNSLGKRGGAVIVGRGANFILPPEKFLGVRIVAPLETRVQNIARTYEVSNEAANRRILNRDSKRRDFVKKSFHVDIADSSLYDLIVNTGKISIEEAVVAVSEFWCRRYLMP